MYKRVILIMALILTGCAGFPKQKKDGDSANDKVVTERMRATMLGDWCGEKMHTDGTYQKWLVKRFADGTYRIDFTTVDTFGSEESWGEYGLWGIRTPIYFTAMRGFIEDGRMVPADTSLADFYDAYKIISLTDRAFTYKSYTSGNVFSINRQCNKRKH